MGQVHHLAVSSVAKLRGLVPMSDSGLGSGKRRAPRKDQGRKQGLHNSPLDLGPQRGEGDADRGWPPGESVCTESEHRGESSQLLRPEQAQRAVHAGAGPPDLGVPSTCPVDECPQRSISQWKIP